MRMTISPGRYQWLKMLLCVLAILGGLLLMWAGWLWFQFVTGNIRSLPDTGGHGFEFFVIALLGVLVIILGCATIVASIYTLSVTVCFKHSINDLDPRARVIAVLVLIAGIGFTVLTVATGALVLLESLISRLLQ
jgi:hypothetical protein